MDAGSLTLSKMYKHIIFNIALFLFYFQLNHCYSDETVKDLWEKDYGKIVHVSLIFRHGDRNPDFTFPTDQYRNYSWKGGLGGLTDVGKRKVVDLGRWFKMRYQHIIDETYNAEQIKVESSSIDRAIMSGQCFLYGFYPTTNSDRWLNDEKWQPIPIYTIPINSDNIIVNLPRCKSYRAQVNMKYTPIYEKFKDWITYIESLTKLDFKNEDMVSIFRKLENLEDTLSIYADRNLNLPPWTLEVYPYPLQTMVSITQRDRTFSVQRSKLATGPLFESIISDMRRKVQDNNYKQVLHVYSGHDVTIRRSLLALKLFNGEVLPYASTLIFELRRKDKEYFVTVSFKNETNSSPYLLKLPNCGLNCSFEKFDQLMSIFIPADWEKECNTRSSNLSSHYPLLIFFTLVFIIIFLVYRKTRANVTAPRLIPVRS